MASFSHGKNAKFYLTDSGATERDISTAVLSVSMPKTVDTADTSAIGSSAKTYVPGLIDATLALEGSRDATIEGYVDGVLGLATTFAYCPEGSATGKIKYSGTVIVTSYAPSSSVSDVSKWSSAGQVSGTITRTTL